MGLVLGCHQVFLVIRRPILKAVILPKGTGRMEFRRMEVLGNLELDQEMR